MQKNEHFNTREILAKIQPVIDNTLMRYDFIPLEVDLVKESQRWFLRIFLYSYTKPVTLDDCEKITRSLDTFLDELIPFKYNLEVSSPGLDRKLKSEKEYSIFAGKTIDIKLKNVIDDSGDKHFKAKLLGFDDEKGVNICKNDTGVEYFIPVSEITSARLCID